MKHKYLQKLFLCTGAVFLFALVGIAAYNSFDRKSIIGNRAEKNEEKELNELDSPVKSSSALHLEDFNRVQLVDGRKVWEVRAHDAKYYAVEELAHVNDAQVIIYRRRSDPVKFSANAGKLYLKGNALEKAELEGNIIVEVGTAVRINTEVAGYNANERLITAPGPVQISGSGYNITGKGLMLEVDSREMTLKEDVKSVFHGGSGSAKALKGIEG